MPIDHRIVHTKHTNFLLSPDKNTLLVNCGTFMGGGDGVIIYDLSHGIHLRQVKGRCVPDEILRNELYSDHVVGEINVRAIEWISDNEFIIDVYTCDEPDGSDDSGDDMIKLKEKYRVKYNNNQTITDIESHKLEHFNDEIVYTKI